MKEEFAGKKYGQITHLTACKEDFSKIQEN
jgi:hypothetical protein